MDKEKVISLIKSKFEECGSPVKIPLLGKDKYFTATLEVEGISVDNLGGNPFLEWNVFVETVNLLESEGGKAIKGSAMGWRLGSEKLPYNSIEGRIAIEVYKKSKGETAFRRISPIVGILRWASICENGRGYLTLNKI